MSTSINLPCALQGTQVIPIEEAIRGGKDYLCPGCKQPVIAKKGEKKVHHFAHKSAGSCSTGYETALHLLAKEIIVRERTFRLPDSSDRFARHKSTTILAADNEITFRLPLAYSIEVEPGKIRSEQKLGNRIPDIIIDAYGKQLVVEIFVTHAVDEEKLNDLEGEGVSVVEVDLSELANVTKDELTKILCEEPYHKTWLYNPKMEQIQSSIEEWDDHPSESKVVIYAAKPDLFRGLEVLNFDQISLKEYQKNRSEEMIILDCPRRLQYSEKGFFAFSSDCESCPFYGGDFERYNKEVGAKPIENGVICVKQESHPKNTLEDFARWVDQFVLIEVLDIKKKSRRGYFLDIHDWISLLLVQANHFISNLNEDSDVEMIRNSVIQTAANTYEKHLLHWFLLN